MLKLKSSLIKNSKKIDKFFDKNLPKPFGMHKKLLQAMRYSTIGSGKKIRGFLVFETGNLIAKTYKKQFTNLDAKEMLVAASAVEAIHSYSLIHDDLPAMDNSDFRRGKRSTHKKYDEATAILAGDALQSWAFELVSNPKNIHNDKVRADIIFNLSRSIGFAGMAAGQQADINFQTKSLSSHDVHWIQEKKTGSLIECCVKLGCILSGSTKYQSTKLSIYSKNLGLAFQIADDLLDLKGDEFKLGKPVKQDLIKNTPNFVNLLGEEKARKKAKNIVDKAIESIKNFGNNSKNLVLLAKYSIDREF